MVSLAVEILVGSPAFRKLFWASELAEGGPFSFLVGHIFYLFLDLVVFGSIRLFAVVLSAL